MHRTAPKIWAMAQKPAIARRRAKPVPPPLYIGEWIRSLGRTPAEVSRGIGRNEGYLSQLISGQKKNPSLGLQQEIADQLGIPPEYLRRPPPDKDFIDQARTLDPAVLDRLRKQ